MSTIAVFVVLGGASYAAVRLPHDSVGAAQLQTHAVTQAKLAPGSVTHGRLSPGVRRRLAQKARRGRRGATGAQGVQGPGGPGAARIRFTAAASASPAPESVLDIAGLQMTAACRLSGTTVGIDLTVRSTEDAVLHDNFTFDTGSDPEAPGNDFSGNLRIALPAGVDNTLGGVSADAPDFGRAIATVIYVSDTRTITLSVASFADAAAGRCSLDGTAVPA
jgi:hypothetical protein